MYESSQGCGSLEGTKTGPQGTGWRQQPQDKPGMGHTSSGLGVDLDKGGFSSLGPQNIASSGNGEALDHADRHFPWNIDGCRRF